MSIKTFQNLIVSFQKSLELSSTTLKVALAIRNLNFFTTALFHLLTAFLKKVAVLFTWRELKEEEHVQF